MRRLNSKKGNALESSSFDSVRRINKDNESAIRLVIGATRRGPSWTAHLPFVNPEIREPINDHQSEILFQSSSLSISMRALRFVLYGSRTVTLELYKNCL